ncbi:MAG TPA: ABC transporter permease [Casimicrobiaceae bacterium]|nr:ABC transporter permease [Casimicrobiaceae bacterium]
MTQVRTRAFADPAIEDDVEAPAPKVRDVDVHPSGVVTPDGGVPPTNEAMVRLAASMVPPPPPAWKRALSRISRLWLLVVFVIAWQLISMYGQRINPQLDVMMPPPTAVISAAEDLAARGVLFMHILDSLKRVLLAVGAATVLGVPLGLAMGWSKRFRAVVDPLLEFIRPIPPLAWIPLSILWFGIGDLQIVYIIFLAAFFPVVLNSLAGARDVDSYLVRAGLSLGASRRELFLTVVLPAALPHIFTGMRIGLGIGWMALVAGELVAAPSGLGYMINNARTLFRSDYILLGMVLIGALGLVLDYLMRQAARFAMPWYQAK